MYTLLKFCGLLCIKEEVLEQVQPLNIERGREQVTIE